MRSLLHLATLIGLAAATTAAADPRLAYVNARPQFNVTDKFFALYIGIWRGFDPMELEAIEDGASLISRRDVSWEVFRCDTGELSHSDRETIWVFDELRLGNDGRVIPIIEAVRPGFRYFSLANLHGLYLRGTGEFRRPRREPREASADYRARVEEARAEWWRAASPKGTKGKVHFTFDMRLVRGTYDDQISSQFYVLDDYTDLAQNDPALKDLFHRTAPNRWPVNYDERAHKPHTFSEPELWRDQAAHPERRDLVRARLEWNWCEPDQPLQAKVYVPYGQSLAEGPNRAGRTDHGPATIEVEEGPF